MKHVASIAGAALAVALIATPAMAAPHGNHGGNQAQAQQHRNNGAWNGQRNDHRREAQNDNRGNRNARNNNGRNWQNGGNDNRKRISQWRRTQNTHAANWRSYHRNFRSPQRFRAARYRAPANYHYRRWSYGQFLPFEYRARSYWLTNFVFYGLFAPPPGLVWVRYGDDALLVDTYTGEIVQVRYDIFYY